ncbi:hypothetical protein HDV00_012517 [Rhizophlyctis rosea]|nr:hypothetical protein HDV00_012517 [Rhizophlyctis rosea]
MFRDPKPLKIWTNRPSRPSQTTQQPKIPAKISQSDASGGLSAAADAHPQRAPAITPPTTSTSTAKAPKLDRGSSSGAAPANHSPMQTSPNSDNLNNSVPPSTAATSPQAYPTLIHTPTSIDRQRALQSVRNGILSTSRPATLPEDEPAVPLEELEHRIRNGSENKTAPATPSSSHTTLPKSILSSPRLLTSATPKKQVIFMPGTDSPPLTRGPTTARTPDGKAIPARYPDGTYTELVDGHAGDVSGGTADTLAKLACGWQNEENSIRPPPNPKRHPSTYPKLSKRRMPTKTKSNWTVQLTPVSKSMNMDTDMSDNSSPANAPFTFPDIVLKSQLQLQPSQSVAPSDIYSESKSGSATAPFDQRKRMVATGSNCVKKVKSINPQDQTGAFDGSSQSGTDVDMDDVTPTSIAQQISPTPILQPVQPLHAPRLLNSTTPVLLAAPAFANPAITPLPAGFDPALAAAAKAAAQQQQTQPSHLNVEGVVMVQDQGVAAGPRDDRPYKCKVVGCYKAYENPGGLKYHMQHDHCEHTSDPEMKNMIQKPYQCTDRECGKRYKNLNGLKEAKDSESIDEGAIATIAKPALKSTVRPQKPRQYDEAAAAIVNQLASSGANPVPERRAAGDFGVKRVSVQKQIRRKRKKVAKEDGGGEGQSADESGADGNLDPDHGYGMAF